MNQFQYIQKHQTKGAYLAKGMPDFGDRLEEQDVADIKNYTLSNAKALREGQLVANK